MLLSGPGADVAWEREEREDLEGDFPGHKELRWKQLWIPTKDKIQMDFSSLGKNISLAWTSPGILNVWFGLYGFSQLAIHFLKITYTALFGLIGLGEFFSQRLILFSLYPARQKINTRTCFFNKDQLLKPLRLEEEAGTPMFRVFLAPSEQCGPSEILAHAWPPLTSSDGQHRRSLL